MTTTSLLQARERASDLASAVAVSGLAEQVAERLGHQLTAYLIGATSTWALADSSCLSPEAESKLRAAYEVCRLMDGREAPRVVQAWMLGMNPYLDDVAPARCIREGKAGFREAVLKAAGELWLHG